MPKTQSYSNHAMFQPAWHYVAFPASAIWFVHAALHAFRSRTAEAHWELLGSLGLVAAVWASRIMVLTAQNRIIRLEMRLRLREVLPAALQSRIGDLSLGQLIGLRFAADAELPGLVERCLAGQLPDAKAVKQAVTDWQPDHLRA